MAEKGGEEEDKLILKNTIQKKIDYLKKKPEVEPEEAYSLVQEFFKAFTEKDYEYTREELIEQLDKFYLEGDVKQSLINVIRELGKVEFSQPNFSQEKINSLLDDFSEALDEIVQDDKIYMGFWDKLVKKIRSHLNRDEEGESNIPDFIEDIKESISEEEAPSPTEEPEEEIEEASEEMQPPAAESQASAEGEVREGSTQHKDFESILEDFNENLQSGNLELARLDYAEMRHAYEDMDSDRKQHYYDSLTDAYERLSEAMQ